MPTAAGGGAGPGHRRYGGLGMTERRKSGGRSSSSGSKDEAPTRGTAPSAGDIEELEKFAPAIAKACREAIDAAKADLDFTRVDPQAFDASPSDSIDYAVMEKTAEAVVVPLDAGWSDVGSWASLHAASNADADGRPRYAEPCAFDHCRQSRRPDFPLCLCRFSD